MKLLEEVCSASAAFRSCYTVVFSVHCLVSRQYIFKEHAGHLLLCLLKEQRCPWKYGMALEQAPGLCRWADGWPHCVVTKKKQRHAHTLVHIPVLSAPCNCVLMVNPEIYTLWNKDVIVAKRDRPTDRSVLDILEPILLAIHNGTVHTFSHPLFISKKQEHSQTHSTVDSSYFLLSKKTMNHTF